MHKNSRFYTFLQVHIKQLPQKHWLWTALAIITFTITAAPHSLQSTALAQSDADALVGPSRPSRSQTSVDRLLPSDWALPAPILSELASSAIAPIYLDGRTVFYLSAPTVEGEQPAELRAKEIQQRLNRFATAQMDKSGTDTHRAKGTVTVSVDEPTKLPVVFVDDQQFLTVTTLDAQFSGYVSSNEYATVLRGKIEAALERYRAERRPDFLQGQAQKAVGIIIGVLLLFVSNRYTQQRLQQRQVGLISTSTELGQTTLSTRPPMMTTAIADTVDSVLDLIRARLDNRQQRKLNEMAIGLLLVLQVGLCIGSVLWVLALFPYSRWITTLLLHWIGVPAETLLIAGVAYTAIRLISLVIDKICLALQEGAQWAPEASQRLSLRFLTFSQVAKGVVGSVIFGVMILTILAAAGVQVGPLLAGAGIIGVGISLAAQSLIKDIINGFLILFEDQFGIGDVIAIGDVTGSVETVNLRITQLRNTEGHLITIPNSQISIVQNLSKDWSQVDLSITVGPKNNIEQALGLFKSTAAGMADDPEWQKFILEPPDLLGIDAIDSTGITLRLFLKTQPLKQWPVARELRQRLKRTFDEAGISIGVPQERLEIYWKDGVPQDGLIPSSGNTHLGPS